jgi:hypothetical protein
MMMGETVETVPLHPELVATGLGRRCGDQHRAPVRRAARRHPQGAYARLVWPRLGPIRAALDRVARDDILKEESR